MSVNALISHQYPHSPIRDIEIPSQFAAIRLSRCSLATASASLGGRIGAAILLAIFCQPTHLIFVEFPSNLPSGETNGENQRPRENVLCGIGQYGIPDRAPEEREAKCGARRLAPAFGRYRQGARL